MQTRWLHNDKPALQLLALTFLFWKSTLLLIAVGSPGLGYDTSTTLIDPSSTQTWLWKLVRWDAVYFTQMAQRGHLFEQEWAFGTGISNALRWAAGVLPRQLSLNSFEAIITGGLLLSHVTHWVSVVLIWLIALRMTRGVRVKDQSSSVPLIAAMLHIISPAGIFLSAPYSESLFASLNMLGFLLYLMAQERGRYKQDFASGLLVIIAGAMIGCATVVRSNGILGGVLYAFDALRACLAILQGRFIKHNFLTLVLLVIGGSLVGIGLLFPQFLAYNDYCVAIVANDRRPWCNNAIPAIFMFVQSHYWNVGLFRYWTLSNLPLFLLALPSLSLLIYSAIDVLQAAWQVPAKSAVARALVNLDSLSLVRLALPQLILAVTALTSYHVQIITRLSSGYPLWYIWLASQICGRARDTDSGVIVRWMLLYGVIQGVLYASFLPPA